MGGRVFLVLGFHNGLRSFLGGVASAARTSPSKRCWGGAAGRGAVGGAEGGCE